MEGIISRHDVQCCCWLGGGGDGLAGQGHANLSAAVLDRCPHTRSQVWCSRRRGCGRGLIVAVVVVVVLDGMV